MFSSSLNSSRSGTIFWRLSCSWSLAQFFSWESALSMAFTIATRELHQLGLCHFGLCSLFEYYFRAWPKNLYNRWANSGVSDVHIFNVLLLLFWQARSVSASSALPALPCSSRSPFAGGGLSSAQRNVSSYFSNLATIVIMVDSSDVAYAFGASVYWWQPSSSTLRM